MKAMIHVIEASEQQKTHNCCCLQIHFCLWNRETP